MSKTLRKDSIPMEEQLINWSVLSKIKAQNTDSIRQNRIPKKYEKDIQLLLYYIRCWKDNKKLVSPEDFKQKIKNLDLISIIMDEK